MLLLESNGIERKSRIMATLGWILLSLAVMILLSYHRASLSVWTIASLVLLLLIATIGPLSLFSLTVLSVMYLVVLLPLNIHYLRRKWLSSHVFRFYRKAMPSMSDTEKAALEAGSVGWEGEIFSGMPDWDKLSALPVSALSEEEQAFLDGPVEQVCRMIDNWSISRKMQIPDAIWDALKKDGFFGMIIPKQFGGKEFSAIAHAQVIMKIASASVAVGTAVAVPNSLGPAELLLKYGTQEQKDHYLPRLATGEDIPCFALTSPVAGSDAGSLTDTGIICHHVYAGEKQLCLRLNWDKRYITLAPIASILGLAFKCYDPDHLLGDKEELGITCALVPTRLEGVSIGRRHYPLDSAFPNGPTQGKDVIIPLDWVIGGAKMVGQGWRMLMECLAAGRSISLPSITTANSKRMTLASSAYARIRRQFNTTLSHFEGVQEVLARMAGNTYAAEALRLFTISYLDQGETPAVASAISKYHTTEIARKVGNDAMDIHGGKGICMGPNNYLAQLHIESPISITVEGANILTRSMIIFGQGAIRCHPYVLKEIRAAQEAVKEPESKHARVQFDRALFSHIGFIISNMVRSFILGITNSRAERVSNVPLRRYYQRFSRFSAAFAYVADMTMLLVGAELKRREALSARLGDVLSLLYIGSAVLKHYENGDNEQELALVKWTCRDLLYRIQTQLDALIANLPNLWVRGFIRCMVFPRGKHMQPPSDRLSHDVAKLLIESNDVRNRLSESLYNTQSKNNLIGNMEKVLAQVIAVDPIEKKISQAYRDGKISGKNLEDMIASAVNANVITSAEAEQLLAADRARMEVINVDDFAPDAF